MPVLTRVLLALVGGGGDGSRLLGRPEPLGAPVPRARGAPGEREGFPLALDGSARGKPSL